MVSDQVDVRRDLFKMYDKQIDDLYTFRDKYYIINEESTNPDDRNQDLLKRLNELAGELEKLDDTKFESKSQHLVLIGRAFNVLPEFSQKAFDSLTKAIKLDPKSMEAWNYLGECYWKKRDFLMCKNCFEQSLNIGRNKLSLRGMSMVMRQLVNVPLSKDQLQVAAAAHTTQPPPTNSTSTTTTTEPSKHDHIRLLLDESIAYAKEAVQLDGKDGTSWYILANCYVAKFFSPFGQQNAALLKQAVVAYNVALRDEAVAALQSDLYFNKSMISMYEEHWPDVLHCLCRALALDPHWSEVRENLKGVLNYLTQLTELVALNGKLKPRRFRALIEQINKADLGPYMDGYPVLKKTSLTTTAAADADTTSQQPQFEKIMLAESRLGELTNGLNANRVLVGKVVCGLPPKNTDQLNLVCFTCCIADAAGECAALTIYNLASGHGVLIGDSVAVPEPWLESVDFGFRASEGVASGRLAREIAAHMMGGEAERQFRFRSVRVENPTVLVVNGKKWTRDKVSSTFFVPKVIAD